MLPMILLESFVLRSPLSLHTPLPSAPLTNFLFWAWSGRSGHVLLQLVLSASLAGASKAANYAGYGTELGTALR